MLCEKPMANTSAACVEMIDACKKANRKLMVAYRLQYEPHHREMIRLCRSKALGPIKTITAVNAQHQGDPNQWGCRTCASSRPSTPRRARGAR
ncbi:hypothetical protein BE20_43295 [Sorangium cellulosum]|uniref:Gfo/Idh/MocA-like oxidoreductase N-terminal domain-containing protein n=1 Tax=Sorangium cellulosum TaxID=56 RepID=A0A150SUU2_SORCE|nr:hypothetical protein BE18_38405 [Sorangium cellulosum]KYF96058.1 hypothetical protein BE20_43295 [Sorangium cellulosum]